MISFFTPSHDPRFLDDCLASLQAQTYEDWEWIVLLNHGATWTSPPDKRVTVFHNDLGALDGIGALKASCCRKAVGDILVELDHDDYLHPMLLSCINSAFEDNPDVGFFYCDSVQINEDGSPNLDKFDLAHGWEYRELSNPEGGICARSMEAFPHNVSYVWYAPNHVRAFRRVVYEKVGGFDPDLDILDDQDLICRMYQEADFIQYPWPHYWQRIHPGNTQRDPDTNAKIQRETVALYDRHIGPNCLAWAKRNNLLALDLGAAHNKPEGYLGVDRYKAEGVDFAVDAQVTLGLVV